ncbi:hypothetical protein LIER_06875 [Lithospermum erythrorhizon]|uniref:Uncharacterized protein n=1 Tax=Lithospermum erythrorhizon TaxID=34254 RepID=A0AAV3P7C9_LITER
MSQTSDKFVGSLLRDSPEASNIATGSGQPSPNMDDSQGQQVTRTETLKSKGSKDPPTLDQVRAKTIPGLITEVQLRALRNHYDFPDGVKTRIPNEEENINTPTTKAEAPEEGLPLSTFRDTALFWEFLNYGLQLPVSRFVDEVLVTLDRAPGLLMPFSWLVLTVFQVAFLAVGVVPNLALFCTMYNVIHKGPLYYFQVASPQYNFLYTKKVDKFEPNHWFRLWFLAKGGFRENVRAHWSMANSIVHAENSAKTQGIDKWRDGFPEALPYKVFCDRVVLIKAGLTKGADNFPKFTLLAFFSRKHASENCTMPHKMAYKSITSGKDVLARVSKRKGSSVPESSTTTKKAKKAPKVNVSAATPSVTTPLEATPFVPEVAVEAFGPPSPRAQYPITIVISDRVSPSLGKSDSSSLPPLELTSGSDGPWLPTPYTLPSGVTVTEDTVSKVKSPIASLLMKN